MQRFFDKFGKTQTICAAVLVVYLCLLLLWPVMLLLVGWRDLPSGADAFLSWCIEHLSLGIMWFSAVLIASSYESVTVALISMGLYFVVVLLSIFGVLFSFKKPRAIWIVYAVFAADIILALFMGRYLFSRISIILFDVGVLALAGMLDRRKTLLFIPKGKLQDI